jgi:hypothetical protein
MSEPCNNNLNPLKLIHDGSRQDQRAPAALKPDYAPADQQQIEQALVFAQRYSKHLRFYDSNLQQNGNWQAFFSRDDAALLAIAATQDLNLYQQTLKASFDYLNDLQHQGNPAALKQNLGFLFSAIASLVLQLENFKQHLGEQVPLKNTLSKLVANQLAQPLRELIAYYKAFPASDSAFAGAHIDLIILGQNAVPFAQLSSADLSRDWQTADGLWTSYFNAVSADASVYGSSADVFERLNHIATHNLFTAIFEQFLTAYARVVSEAQQSLQQHLTDSDQHSPHFALFLAFLSLLQNLRSDINTLTQRHLDFYYRDILQLKEKPPLPGKAHVLVDLAKHRDQHAIADRSLFKAGKDAHGKPVMYAADSELIANKTRITALKTLYRHSNTGSMANSETLPLAHGRLYASPVANSDDGLGAKLTSSDASWSPLFNKVYDQGKLQNIRMPTAEIGFAIASHYLYLAEGARGISLQLPSALPAGIDSADFECLVSGEKSWLILATTISSNRLTLNFALSGDDPAVTAYNSKIHGYALDTDLPVLLLRLSQDPQRQFVYDRLRDLQLERIVLSVTVSKLKQLTLSNDFGPIDSSKPFQPFGALPVANNYFIIGSQEAFRKQLTGLDLHIDWQNQPTPYAGDVKIGVDCLQGGEWQALNGTQYPVNCPHYVLDSSIIGRFADNSDYSASYRYSNSSRNGFLKLRLQQDFGHRAYEIALLEYIRSKGASDNTEMQAKTSSTGGGNSSENKTKTVKLPPQVPVGPYIAQITLSYTASQSIILDDANLYAKRLAKFFHITPFGYAEQHAKLAANVDGIYVFPQLLKPLTDMSQAAELIIGLGSLEPPQSLSLLFQVVDGTADALSDKPKSHLQWQYLQDNRWRPFKQLEVQDASQAWLKSGIVQLQIPTDINTNNTVLPGDQYWIKAEVFSECDAVCRLLGIDTQAVGASFVDQGNDPAFAASALPAESISKLQQPDAAVKALRQPYSGFGGRGNEDDQAFYIRVSERLRHKDRAIAQWDYEHLVLEAFPEIFQVKCLNHTWYDGAIYRELAAGHVTLVALPNQRTQVPTDPLRPYTSLGLLTQIADYVRARAPGFVQLHVKNPEFEEITANFNVCFYPGLDSSYYSKQLNQALMGFLSPWAFDNATAPSFGGKVYRARVLNFVEDLPYVDYVSEFRLAHQYIDLDGQPQLDQDNAEIHGSKAISILVSARQHGITVIDPAATAATTLCPCVSS